MVRVSQDESHKELEQHDPRIRFRNFLAASLVLLAAGGVLGGYLLAHEGPGGRGLRMLGRMARHLDLTDDQKTRIREIYESRSVRLQEQREAKRNARRALADAIQAEPTRRSGDPRAGGGAGPGER